jgi:hypothetical protein
LPEDESGPQVVDAIIVPTSRPARRLGAAVDYAQQLGCTLVVLCSQQASVADVEALAKKANIELVAIDTGDLPAGLLPDFETSELVDELGFVEPRDTASKRNVALLFAQLIGWQRIFFLDDDITVDDPQQLARAAEGLVSHDAVGLQVSEFPDNSVVCHAGRQVGLTQQTFIGAGALAVHVPSASRSFFPQVYNEDWFFLLGDNGLRPAAILGGAKQTEYDPFADLQRAGFEEFGDSLAEGIFWALDNGGDIADASVEHWRMFLARRREFIKVLLDRLDRTALDDQRRKQIWAALRTALARNATIEPQFCVDYLNAWRVDRDRWLDHVNARQSEYLNSAVRASSVSTAEKVLSELGLMAQGRYVAVDRSVVAASGQPAEQDVALL